MRPSLWELTSADGASSILWDQKLPSSVPLVDSVPKAQVQLRSSCLPITAFPSAPRIQLPAPSWVLVPPIVFPPCDGEWQNRLSGPGCLLFLLLRWWQPSLFGRFVSLYPAPSAKQCSMWHLFG